MNYNYKQNVKSIDKRLKRVLLSSFFVSHRNFKRYNVLETSLAS